MLGGFCRGGCDVRENVPKSAREHVLSFSLLFAQSLGVAIGLELEHAGALIGVEQPVGFA